MKRVAADAVFDAAEVAGDGDVGLDATDREHRTEHRRSAAHVDLHLEHAVSGFDVEAAAVEGETFANESDVLLRLAARSVFEADDARRRVGQ